MNSEHARNRHCSILPAVLLALTLAACAGVEVQEPRQDDVAAVMRYNHTLGRMPAAEMIRQRNAASAWPATPANQMRHAMLLASPRQSPDYTRAIGLLEGLLRSSDAAASALHPLARLLIEQYGERQRLDSLADRQALQLKESQKQAAELQEKLDRLTDIERTLSSRPEGRGGRK